MARESLKNLLSKFPYFLDKTESSNFYKSQFVTNERFKDVYQSLFETVESFHLNKRVLIWKEQFEPYVYSIHFVVNFPNLKSVKILKNEDIIYSEDYLYSDEITSFNYTYSCDDRNEGLFSLMDESEDEELIRNESSIIPEDKFILIVETYDEHVIQKGFPENDVFKNDIFDHDESLDEIGALHNIPRKEYHVIDENEFTELELIYRYNNTEPSFNNQASEDDYHYMNRIIGYVLKTYNVPLPVAEIWKLYGIEDVSMLNRERLLLKMFDVTKYPTIENDNGDIYVGEWDPKPYEHKDGFCEHSNLNKILFLVDVNTTYPNKFSTIKFNCNFLDYFGEPVDFNDYIIEVSLNGNPFEEDFTNGIKTELLDDLKSNIFIFTAKTINNEIIGECEIEINVKGCMSGDIYVNADGDDNNDGSINSPFKTLGKALSQVNNNQNLIIIGGEVEFDNLYTANSSCTIMGCNNGKLISNLDDNRFLNVAKGVSVTLNDITLQHESDEVYLNQYMFTNENSENSNMTIIIESNDEE